MLSFSRGTSDFERHTFTAECTGHLLLDSVWTHLGPGRYECPETTLSAIPSGSIFSVRRSDQPPVVQVNFKDPSHALQLIVDCLDFVADATTHRDYVVQYDAGPGTLVIGADTLPGVVVHSARDFTGFNRLAGNTRGYFPGQYELAALAAADGSIFVFSTDPVARYDPDARVNTNFAACRRANGETAVMFDSVGTAWLTSTDTLFSGKPIPSEWSSTVQGRTWHAHYSDLGHFFYFTGFGIFAVQGTAVFNDTTFKVSGIVEHIHARNHPR